MPNTEDMTTPVTRGELRKELEQLEQRLDQKFDRKLEIWGGALLAEIRGVDQRLSHRMDGFEQRMDSFEQRLGGMVQELSAEFARHAQALLEASRSDMGVVDEKYKDLSARVTRLEDHVFAPKKRRR